MTRLNVGLIGAGGIAAAHLPAWIDLGARVTVVSTDGRAPELAARWPHADVSVADSVQEVCAASEIVDICTPTYNHAEIAHEVIAAGRDVLCEKPFALTVEDAVGMADAAAAAGVRLLPGHVVRYFPAYAALQRAVAAGEIGEPAVLRFTRTGPYPTAREWFSDVTRSGGILMDQMIHDMDFARWLAGEVVGVYARTTGHGSVPARPGDVATGTAVLTHASGAISHVFGVWGKPDLQFRTTFSVSGTDGVLHHDSTDRPGFRALARGDREAGEVIPTSALHESPFLTELRELAAACSGGPEPRVSADDGVAAVRIAAAALESAQTGQVVVLERASVGKREQEAVR